MTKKNSLLVGLTLFSMFFGAGNLIFPPFLGNQAGTNIWIAMAGFAVTAIAFPILGVITVTKSGGLDILARRVHPLFTSLFTLLIYVSIGPGLAIPRTASTSFEMAALPFLPAGTNVELFQIIYSCIFFIIAFSVALKPEKLTERLGKILTPCLLGLITIIFIKSVCQPTAGYNFPAPAYKSNVFVKGFLEGYQTMDTIAALNFGIIIALGIRSKGIQDDNQVVKETIKAGFIAGGLLLIIYSALGHIGALASASYQESTNGANVLTYIAKNLFGQYGVLILGAIFFIACLNTCVGLLCCCSEYFITLFPNISYRIWVGVFAGISFVISNLGLNKILKVSIPILHAIYPIAIVLIILACMHSFISKWKYIYPITIFITGLTSTLYVTETLGLKLYGISAFLHKLPFYEQGLLWITPAIAGIFAGIIFSVIKGISYNIKRGTS